MQDCCPGNRTVALMWYVFGVPSIPLDPHLWIVLECQSRNRKCVQSRLVWTVCLGVSDSYCWCRPVIENELKKHCVSSRATTKLWTGGHLEFLSMRWLLVILPFLLISQSRSTRRLCLARYSGLIIRINFASPVVLCCTQLTAIQHIKGMFYILFLLIQSLCLFLNLAGTIPVSLQLRPEGPAEEPASGRPDEEIWEPEERREWHQKPQVVLHNRLDRRLREKGRSWFYRCK